MAHTFLVCPKPVANGRISHAQHAQGLKRSQYQGEANHTGEPAGQIAKTAENVPTSNGRSKCSFQGPRQILPPIYGDADKAFVCCGRGASLSAGRKVHFLDNPLIAFAEALHPILGGSQFPRQEGRDPAGPLRTVGRDGCRLEIQHLAHLVDMRDVALLL